AAWVSPAHRQAGALGRELRLSERHPAHRGHRPRVSTSSAMHAATTTNAPAAISGSVAPAPLVPGAVTAVSRPRLAAATPAPSSPLNAFSLCTWRIGTHGSG